MKTKWERCVLSDDSWGIKNKVPLVLEELSQNNTPGNWNYPSRTKNNHLQIWKYSFHVKKNILKNQMKQLWGNSYWVPSTASCNSTKLSSYSYSDLEVIPFIFSANCTWFVLVVNWSLPDVFLSTLFSTEHSESIDTCVKKSVFEDKISKSLVSKH